MKTIVLEQKNTKFYRKVNRLEFDEIPDNLRHIEDDTILLYKNKYGDTKFLCKYVKKVISDTNDKIKNRLIDYVTDKEYNTYLVDHDINSKQVYETIELIAEDVIELYFNDKKEKEENFHFFYNETILNHRDCLYTTLRSLHALQHEKVKALFVFTDFDVYIDLEEGDLLLFDASHYHYMRRNIEPSNEFYRFAINML
tara:strand:- start:617 stop:1210 length:594 start_codon:yes stop_codon:yes gene_type:complete